MGEKMRTKEEIKKAIIELEENKELCYGYKEDTFSVLNWVLGTEELDGLKKGERK